MSDMTGTSPGGLPRVFVIGFNRCGTRTIHWYFKSNGYQAVHWDEGNLANAMFRNLVESLPLLAGYESFSIFSDMELITRDFAFEAYKLYRYLDAAYPNSVFILNTRDADKWISSRLEHGNGGYARKWKRLLHVTTDDELITHWRDDWNAHHRNVDKYFSGSQTRFLKFNIETDQPQKLNDALPEYTLDLGKYAPQGRRKR
ncbi:MAG TPA: sulfotransferase [Rhizomicrobium sp.]|jgi:hypothetical protein|nr:sulfotransferase [Rhizomicrobium sp.]